MPTCLKCLSLSFRIFIVPREFNLYFGGTHIRYLFLHTALEHGIVQVHPKTSVLATNVSLSHTSLVGIVLKKRNNFKDQFYIIIFCSTEMNYSDFIFFLQSKHMVFKPYKRIICSGLIKWCSFIRLFNY